MEINHDNVFRNFQLSGISIIQKLKNKKCKLLEVYNTVKKYENQIYIYELG